MNINLKKCHVDTLCLVFVFAVGTYIVHKKIQEDYRNYKEVENN